MAEFRRDPISGRWVLLAPGRSDRPRDTAGANESDACPFCPGNEAMTPSEVDRIPASGGTGGGWAVRVVPNRYPAAAPDAPAPADARPFESAPAIGAHEVVIETPAHDTAFSDLAADQAARVFEMYQRRFRALSEQPGVRRATIFRNQGSAAGSSRRHPHSQIIATGVEIPERPARGDGCGVCRVLSWERAARARMLFEVGGFSAVTPFASEWPFEVWIVPTEHPPSFGHARAALLRGAASATQRVLRMVRAALNDPAFNFMVDLPGEGGGRGSEAGHWRVRVVPRIGVPGGFELATGTMINSVPPEHAAAVLQANDAGRGEGSKSHAE